MTENLTQNEPMRRILIVGSSEWANWFALRNVLHAERKRGPFVAVLVAHGELGERCGISACSGKRTCAIVGSVDEYVRTRTGLDTEQVDTLDPFPEVDLVLAFPGANDFNTFLVMKAAYAAGVPVQNHGYQPYTREAHRQARLGVLGRATEEA